MSTKDRIKERYSDTQRKILHHLKSGLKAGKSYFKSKYMESVQCFYPKELSINLVFLSELCVEVDISRWCY